MLRCPGAKIRLKSDIFLINEKLPWSGVFLLLSHILWSARMGLKWIFRLLNRYWETLRQNHKSVGFPSIIPIGVYIIYQLYVNYSWIVLIFQLRQAVFICVKMSSFNCLHVAGSLQTTTSNYSIVFYLLIYLRAINMSIISYWLLMWIKYI